MNVDQEPKFKKRKIVSAEDVSRIGTDCGLSTNTVHKIATALRVATNDRKLFEPNLKQKVKNLNHTLDSYFSVKECNVTKSKNNQITTTSEIFVFCNNVNELIDFVKEKREVDEVHLKIGIDSGGGFIKVCLSIQSSTIIESDIESIKCRQKYSDGPVAKNFKDSGVKKLLLLGIIAHAQENYENVLLLWSLLNIQILRATIATDLKIANILSGIMSHASSFPCTWCTASKNELHKCGDYRTINTCKENYSAWQKSGSQKSTTKKYNSSIHEPIISSEDSSTRILEVIPPPELHLGAVNTIYKNMLLEFECESMKWAQACNMSREFVHGSPAFIGNSCKTLLNKIDLLHSICIIA